MAATILSNLIEIFHEDIVKQLDCHKIDLTIFQNLKQRQCIENHANDNNYKYIKNCDHLKRIAAGLNYYNSFCQNAISLDRFTQFNETIYTNFLDDYCHFIKEHNYHLRPIRKELNVEYGLAQCNFNMCEVVERHYRTQREKESVTDLNKLDAFYLDCFDRLHHHLFHLEIIGMRVIQKNHGIISYGEMDECYNSREYEIDHEFKRIKETIFSKRNKFLSHRNIQRYQSQNKYNIVTIDNKLSCTTTNYPKIIQLGNNLQIRLIQPSAESYGHTSDVTFLDGLFRHVARVNDCSENELKRLIEFIRSERYDSDALKEDLKHANLQTHSNLCKITDGTTELISAFLQFITNLKCMNLL